MIFKAIQESLVK